MEKHIHISTVRIVRPDDYPLLSRGEIDPNHRHVVVFDEHDRQLPKAEVQALLARLRAPANDK